MRFAILLLAAVAAWAQSSGLVASWPATDGSGSMVANTATGQSGNPLTCNNATWAGVNVPITNAIALNGTTSYCSSANNTAFNFDSTQSFSISTWVKTSNANLAAQAIIGTLDANNNLRGWELTLVNSGVNSSIVYFLLMSNYPSNALIVNNNGGQVIRSNELYHIVVTYPGTKSASDVKMYVNGTLQPVGLVGNTLTGGTTNSVAAQVGRRLSSADLFAGNILPTYIYNRVLTSSEANTLHTTPYVTLNPPPPTGTNAQTVTFTDIAPIVGDDGIITILNPAQAIHLNRISCGVKGNTSAVVNLVKNGMSLISDMVATTGDANSVVVTTWANGSAQCGGIDSCAVAARTPVTVHIGTISGAPTALSCSVDYTVD